MPGAASAFLLAAAATVALAFVPTQAPAAPGDCPPREVQGSVSDLDDPTNVAGPYSRGDRLEIGARCRSGGARVRVCVRDPRPVITCWTVKTRGEWRLRIIRPGRPGAWRVSFGPGPGRAPSFSIRFRVAG